MRENKVILVTGGSKGIGENICIKAASKYSTLIFTYHKNQKKAFAIKNRLLNINQNIHALKLDLTKQKSINKLLSDIKNKIKIKNIDILINNAAVSQIKKVSKITNKDWEFVLNSNLRGPFFLTQKIVEQMKNKQWGRIVNISSIGGQWGGKDQVHYAISKSGIIGMTKSFAKVYSKSNITCNAVSPGLVLTNMSKNEIYSKAGKKKIKNIPVGRIANMSEITDTVMFLCKKESSYITGQTINVNGGMLFS